jgi:hypothetical protein
MNKYMLGRKVNHDSRSLSYGFNTKGLSIVSVVHNRLIPILNQLQTSSCTGNAGIGAINTAPFIQNASPYYSPDENGALKLYRDAEIIDGGVGYPPEDVGSSGLSIAKALTNAGLISGYQHTFTLNDALMAGSLYPFITGINWYSDMFNPDPDGRVHPTGNIVGGHEIVLSEIDVPNGKIFFTNSWGNTWGVNGRFYLTWADYATLLGQQGDVIVLFPDIVPPPAPPKPPVALGATLIRNIDNGTETLGTLTTSDNQFQCRTLELSWRNNQQNISCIPTGTYLCQWKFMLRELRYRYQIMNIPNRSGIFFHTGNFFFDSQGCIILGSLPQIIPGSNQPSVINTRPITTAFEKKMGGKDFQLTIIK